LLLSLGLTTSVPGQDSISIDWWFLARATFPQPLRRSFDSLVLLVSWCLWKERNQRTFDHHASTATDLIERVIGEANGWISSGFSSLALLTAMAV
jgi:hypothetical protein